MAKWCYGIAAIIVCLDQATKMLANNYLVTETINLLPILSLRLACNTGAAFSILEGASWLLIGVGVIFSAYFITQIWRLLSGSICEASAYTLILAGAIGNLIDRVAFGCVTDFVHFFYISNNDVYSFPIFNLADTAITLGAACWIYFMLFQEKTNKSEGNKLN